MTTGSERWQFTGSLHFGALYMEILQQLRNIMLVMGDLSVQGSLACVLASPSLKYTGVAGWWVGKHTSQVD